VYRVHLSDKHVAVLYSESNLRCGADVVVQLDDAIQVYVYIGVRECVVHPVGMLHCTADMRGVRLSAILSHRQLEFHLSAIWLFKSKLLRGEPDVRKRWRQLQWNKRAQGEQRYYSVQRFDVPDKHERMLRRRRNVLIGAGVVV
jgi:hypothetical protein